MHDTELILSIAGFPPYSGRGCFQQLMPIQEAMFRRTINGALTYINVEEHQKYRSVIRGRDVSSPAFDTFWVGTQMTVGCIHRLWQRLNKGETQLTLIRPPVEHSICVVDRAGHAVPFSAEGS
ncbi:MAG: hypothetical protein LBQ26_00500, partial [Holosporales bacterium]|nr:hypothetical protein [Holosporales bacterium]